jgi:2-O-methyltransferase
MFRRAVELMKSVSARWATVDVHQIPFKTIRSHLPRNPVCVEAGAHRGQHTVHLSRIWRDCTIHAFEPVPELFAEMSRRTDGIGRIRKYPLALSDRCGEAVIHISGGASDASSSLLKPSAHLVDHPQITFQRELTIETTTLDAWADRHGIDHVDFLWLDLQGHEFAAIEGASRLLAGVRAIHSEVSLKQVYEGGLLYPEFRARLAERGFRVAAESLPYQDMGDALFVRD